MDKIIRLSLDSDAELDWKVVGEEGSSILWHLDLGFQKRSWSPFDSGQFQMFAVALETFSRDVLHRHLEKTSGVILYQGDLSLSSLSEIGPFQENFEEFCTLYGTVDISKDRVERLFKMNLFSEYLHRLAGLLPVAVPLLCLFDCTGEKIGSVAQLLSKRRFEFFELAIRGVGSRMREWSWSERGIENNGTKTLALCLPRDEKIDAGIHNLMERTLSELGEKGIDFRVIPEEILNEEWDGIESMLLIASALTSQGLRRVQGFSIAGGRLVFLDNPLDFENEISFEEFKFDINRSRGI